MSVVFTEEEERIAEAGSGSGGSDLITGPAWWRCY
jgi:hypothetical protein